MRWPRTRTIANAALLVVLSLMCGSIVAGLNGWYEERDFHCWWVAGRIAASGGDPYDTQQFVPIIRTLPPSEARALHRCRERLSYPPWTGAALALFGAIPLPVAASLWASLAVLAAVLGIHWTRLLSGLRRLSWTLILALVVGTQPFMRAFEEGQFATFIFALTAEAALAMRSKSDLVAGIATAALALKPHTAIGFAGVFNHYPGASLRWSP